LQWHQKLRCCSDTKSSHSNQWHQKLRCCSDSSVLLQWQQCAVAVTPKAALLQWHQKLTQQPVTPKAALLQWQQCVMQTSVSVALIFYPSAWLNALCIALSLKSQFGITNCTKGSARQLLEYCIHTHYQTRTNMLTGDTNYKYTHSLSNKNKHAHWWYKL